MQFSYDFPTRYEKILDRLNQYNPSLYGSTRNYLTGAVTYLSPYISRGILSTKRVYNSLIEREIEPKKIEKLIQELAWRDYWQLVWIEKKDDILYDLKRDQYPVKNRQMPIAVANAQTGITAIDSAVEAMKATGYMHNHLRMYVASICCNVAYSHWKQPAQWLYYYLLDADVASNHLSWQWVAGSNANKKYVANQENVNKFCGTTDRNTFLDIDYAQFDGLEQPSVLKETTSVQLKTNLPETTVPIIEPNRPTYIYNFYNVDVEWGKQENANRILLLEPSIFERFPVANHSIDFVVNLAKNIDGIQLVVGEFDQLIQEHQLSHVHYKEHPLNQHYQGVEHPRDWLTSESGYFSSFFKFWNKAKKQLL